MLLKKEEEETGKEVAHFFKYLKWLNIFPDRACFSSDCGLNYVVALLQLSLLQPRDLMHGTKKAQFFQFLSLVDYPNSCLTIPFVIRYYLCAGGGVLRNSIQSPGRKLQLVRGLGNNGRWAANVDRYRAEHREPWEKSWAGQQQYDQREEKRLLAYSREIKEGLLT